MMKTLAFCLHHKSGYTLIELLVVLLIFSLLSGIVLPRLTVMYDSMQAAYEREDILSTLSHLNYQAFRQGKKFKLVQYPIEKKEIISIPEESGTDIDKENIEYVETSEEESGKKLADSIVEDIPLELPEGWKLRTESPIVFRANGVCGGGVIYLQYYEEAEFRVKLTPPFCRAVQS
jgi:prepilin-type N-terminal cleavage/methylation domain-containing protein